MAEDVEETVTLTRAEYDELLEQMEDLEASYALLKAQQADDGTRIPHAVVRAEVVDGAHPIAAWRHYLGWTVRHLARAAGVSAAYLTEIETGRKPGSVAAFKAVADALGVSVDVLIPEGP